MCRPFEGKKLECRSIYFEVAAEAAEHDITRVTESENNLGRGE